MQIDVTKVTGRTSRQGPPSTFAVSFPQAIIWGVMGCAAAFSISLVIERTRGTLVRLRCAPIRGWHILLGKGGACFLTTTAVAMLLLALGAIVGVRPTPAEWRFAAGALATVAVAIPLSVASHGSSAWSEFAENSRVHLSTPLANHVGLRTVLSYDASMRTELARDATLDDPMGPWKEARQARFASFAWLHLALVHLAVDGDRDPMTLLPAHRPLLRPRPGTAPSPEPAGSAPRPGVA